MNELALFAGAGGGILGGLLNGWRTVCAVEIEDYCRRVLMQRQDDGFLEPFPIWDDIRTFDGRPWAGCVDIVTGGFPCQDISAAGKGAGIDGQRSGLWREMARVVREVGPRYVFVENSPMLTLRGLGTVLGDLAAMGLDAEWGVLGADDAGAPHHRKRIWILAYSAQGGRGTRRPRRFVTGGSRKPEQPLQDVAASESGKPRKPPEWEGRENTGGRSNDCGRNSTTWGTDVPHTNRPGRQERQPAAVPDWAGQYSGDASAGVRRTNGEWWGTEPDVGRMAHGVAARVDRLKAIGNGQVPAVVALAWEVLNQNRKR